MSANASALFTATKIGKVEFKNRLLRSSIGGRTAYYDGTVNDAWETFERRFASGGVAGIISATLTVDDQRWSPLEYPAISHDRYVKPLAEKIERLQNRFGCRYIIQVGDPGYATQTSLFKQDADALTATSGIDPLYGYVSLGREMSVDDIKKVVQNFGRAAVRVKSAGCDGIELTASKGYMVHQFLNPGTNRRKDDYGGSLQRRFRFLKEVVETIRSRVGPDFLFGVRLSSRDYNRSPWPELFRFGPGLWPSAFSRGNDLDDMLQIGDWLQALGVDYLHISSGFGFINPHENPGRFPTREVKMFTDSTRPLGWKSTIRSTLLHLLPTFVMDPILNIGWTTPDASGFNMLTNLDDARAFKRRLRIPIIVNAGFQRREHFDAALGAEYGCDMVSMARPLLANPHLPRMLAAGIPIKRERECTFCNRCAVRTTLFPLGCYEPARFQTGRHGTRRTDDEVREFMERQIERFNRPKQRPTPQSRCEAEASPAART
jgi:2,4-dienoyl-CoA reductase-like NADH-dependent reductase (Old Yellow Enzyme family)